MSVSLLDRASSQRRFWTRTPECYNLCMVIADLKRRASQEMPVLQNVVPLLGNLVPAFLVSNPSVAVIKFQSRNNMMLHSRMNAVVLMDGDSLTEVSRWADDPADSLTEVSRWPSDGAPLMCYSPDGACLLLVGGWFDDETSDRGSTVCLIDGVSAQTIAKRSCYDITHASALAFAPCNEHLAVGGYAEVEDMEVIHIMAPVSLETIKIVQLGMAHLLSQISYTPEGDKLVSAWMVDGGMTRICFFDAASYDELGACNVDSENADALDGMPPWSYCGVFLDCSPDSVHMVAASGYDMFLLSHREQQIQQTVALESIACGIAYRTDGLRIAVLERLSEESGFTARVYMADLRDAILRIDFGAVDVQLFTGRRDDFMFFKDVPTMHFFSPRRYFSNRGRVRRPELLRLRGESQVTSHLPSFFTEVTQQNLPLGDPYLSVISTSPLRKRVSRPSSAASAEQAARRAVIQEVTIEEPASQVFPSEAAQALQELWASSVESRISSAQRATDLSAAATGDRSRPVAHVSFSRNSDQLEAALLESTVARRAVECGIDVLPDWSNGGKVFVDKFGPQHVEPPVRDLHHRDVFVYIDEVDELMSCLEHLPYGIRKAKPGRITMARGLDLMHVSSSSASQAQASSSASVANAQTADVSSGALSSDDRSKIRRVDDSASRSSSDNLSSVVAKFNRSAQIEEDSAAVEQIEEDSAPIEWIIRNTFIDIPDHELSDTRSISSAP